MKKLLLLVLTLAAPVFAEPAQRYLVAMRNDAAPSRLRVMSNATAASAHEVRTFKYVNAFAANLTAEEAAELRQSPDVASVAPVVARHADGLDVTTHVDFLRQATPWGITAVRAQSVWPVTRGEDVNVVVIDTGVDPAHPDLVHAYAGGFNVIDPQVLPIDDNTHGTHVAGTILAANNDFGVVGVAPAAKLWAVKVLDKRGEGTDEGVAAGIDWVVDQAKARGGRWVINMSLSAPVPSDVEQLAVARALTEGIVIVASAGNRSAPHVRYPARYRGVIAVGAVDDEMELAGFSSYGLGLTLMAPGVAIPSTMIRGLKNGADVRFADEVIEGWGVDGSPLGVVQGQIVDCALGKPHEFPAEVAGRIALVYRGEIPFREKARNAKEAGASAVVIWNNEIDEKLATSWSMKPLNGDDPGWETYPFPLTIGVTRMTGIRLLATTALVTVGYRELPYGNLNGTSMAAPHVTGVVALMLSAAPSTAAAQIKYALEHSAQDIGDPGPDFQMAWGLVDALAATQYVAPEKFGVPPPQPTPSPRRRASH
jgi:subtilisin family serine protease